MFIRSSLEGECIDNFNYKLHLLIQCMELLLLNFITVLLIYPLIIDERNCCFDGYIKFENLDTSIAVFISVVMIFIIIKMRMDFVQRKKL